MGRDTIKDSIKTLGKLVIAATLTNPLGKAAAEVVLEHITAWLSREEKDPLIKIENNLIAELEAYTNEGLPDDLLIVSMGNVKSLFENCALSLSDLVDLNLDPKKAADKLINKGDRFLEDQYKAMCRELVFRIYKTFLSGEEAEKIPGLHIAIDKAMLDNLEKLKKLPDEINNAFTERSAQALISSRYMPMKKHFPPTALLRAEHCIVPFHPVRNDLCSELESWFDLDIPIGVKLITGSGGSGKTRLCIELAKRLRINRDIKAGFLDSRADRASDDVLDKLIPGNGSILLVIDYAETRSGITEKILMRAADYEGDEKIRIILLSRSASDWWERLKCRENGVGDLISSYYYTDKIELSNQDVKPEQRTDVFLKAAEALAEKRNLEKSKIIAPDLNATHFGTMLFIHLAAFAATEGKVLHGRDELIDFIIRRETRQWSNLLVNTSLQVFDNQSISQAASLLTLAGGATRNEAPDLLKQLKIFEDQQNINLTKLFKTFHSLYPDGERAGAVVPDLIGERLVESVIIQEMADNGNKSELLQTAFSLKGKQLQNTFTLLTRLAKYKPERESWIRDNLKKDFKRLAKPAFQAAMETGDPLGRIMAQVMEETQDVEVASIYVWNLPEKTIILREFAMEVTKVCYKVVKNIMNMNNNENQTLIAIFANDLSFRCSAIGRREEALSFALEAVDVNRKLAIAAPNSFGENLAASLGNLSICYSESGNKNESLRASMESVEIFYKLASYHPESFILKYTRSLMNLSNSYSANGLNNEALASAEKAVKIFLKLHELNGRNIEPHLAMSYNLLSNRYSNSGQISKAVLAGMESVKIYRRLAYNYCDQYEQDLADALNNLSSHLSSNGRLEEAIEVINEAITIRHKLYKILPDAFRKYLTQSMHLLESFLTQQGKTDESQKVLEEIKRLEMES